jgi:hypothetical protein
MSCVKSEERKGLQAVPGKPPGVELTELPRGTKKQLTSFGQSYI